MSIIICPKLMSRFRNKLKMRRNRSTIRIKGPMRKIKGRTMREQGKNRSRGKKMTRWLRMGRKYKKNLIQALRRITKKRKQRVHDMKHIKILVKVTLRICSISTAFLRYLKPYFI